jgi:hypothetical protein
MKGIEKLLLVAGLTVLLQLATAPAAHAISPMAEDQCDALSAADDDLWDYFANYSTVGFGPNGCSSFCQGVRKVCYVSAKTRGKCVKGGDKFHHILTRKLCDDDKECQAAAKADEVADKIELKLAAQDAKAECAALGEACLADCNQGSINPQQ